jgi:hypothetical protein
MQRLGENNTMSFSGTDESTDGESVPADKGSITKPLKAQETLQ